MIISSGVQRVHFCLRIFDELITATCIHCSLDSRSGSIIGQVYVDDTSFAVVEDGAVLCRHCLQPLGVPHFFDSEAQGLKKLHDFQHAVRNGGLDLIHLQVWRMPFLRSASMFLSCESQRLTFSVRRSFAYFLIHR